MKRKVLCTLVGLAVFFLCAVDAEARQNKGAGPVGQDKLRVIILTDIGGDPDDEESMVRFLTYCNEFDVEGVIATDRCPRDERPQVLPEKIIERVKAYGQIRDNLLLHAQGYPTVKYLLGRVKSGNWVPKKGKWLPKIGRSSYVELKDRIGPDKGSEASNWIIEVVDRPDKRPVQICIWGGSSDLAQALWQVRKTRSFAGARRHWAVARWRRAFQNDFKARMDWCVKTFDQANHNPIAALNGDTGKKIVELTARPGSRVKLSAAGLSDPDGDKLSYRWFVYKEAGDYPNEITIKNADTVEAVVLIPDDATGREIHVILEVTDNGKPVLYSYRRVIFNVR